MPSSPVWAEVPTPSGPSTALHLATPQSRSLAAGPPGRSGYAGYRRHHRHGAAGHLPRYEILLLPGCLDGSRRSTLSPLAWLSGVGRSTPGSTTSRAEYVPITDNETVDAFGIPSHAWRASYPPLSPPMRWPMPGSCSFYGRRSNHHHHIFRTRKQGLRVHRSSTEGRGRFRMRQNQGCLFADGKAFIPFLTCGDPDLETTRKPLVRVMAGSGRRLIRLSDPASALLQRGQSSSRPISGRSPAALQQTKILKWAEAAKRDLVPLVFMTCQRRLSCRDRTVPLRGGRKAEYCRPDPAGYFF